MVRTNRHTLCSARCVFAQFAFCFAMLIANDVQAADAVASPTDEPLQREIFVPFDDLHVILSSDIQRVFVTREEYEALAAKAKLAARPEAIEQPAAVLSADYVATIEENRARIIGTLFVTAPNDALSAVELDLSGVALRTATLDGKPAALGRDPAGLPVLFVSGAGRHELKLEILAPLDTAAAQRTLSFRIPTPPATRLKLTVPGNVEIKSGATIIRRDLDERPATTFDLLPRRGQNSVVMSLNNHQLQKESVVVAHAVLIDEITSAFERLHVTESMSVLHGAADEFRFALPVGFEVTSVAAPQVARWAVTTEKGQRILDVHLREPASDTVTLNISAIHTPAALAQWRLPKLAALDVAGETAVVGVLLENRLKPHDLQPKNLISIDAGALAQAIAAASQEGQAGTAAMAPAAAFYAPRGDYDLNARFAPPPAELRVTTNVLLTLTESKLEARGGFALLNATDKLIEFDFSAPGGWQVAELTQDGGIALPLETYPTDDGGTRIHVRLPQASPLGQTRNVYFRAVSTPSGWLDEWTAKQVQFPVFQVTGATRDGGAIAVQSQDDLRAHADQITRLTPLDSNEKSKYGLANVTTELAYRYDAPPYGLTLAVERVEPRLSARAFSFFRVEPDLLTAHYEIAYDVTEARASRLTFALPATSPAELSIHGLAGVTIKESKSIVKGSDRQWTVLLGESKRGALRLAVDFQQPLGDRNKDKNTPTKKDDKAAPATAANDVTLPLVRALNVAYQTGMVAVEGSSDSDVQVKTDLRKIDVGLLAEADYQPGRRLLGAFGYGGDDAEVKVAIARPPGYELPTTIVERAELLTMVSASGRSQTVARFQLRSKAQLIEVRLPTGSALWSAYLDGTPTQPQREADSLLIDLPATAEARRRTLQLVYETPVNTLGMASSLNLAAPKLLLRAKRSEAGEEVPLAELVWQLCTPDGFKVVRSNGTVFSGDIAARESPVTRVAAVVGSVFPGVSSARESARRKIQSVDSSLSMPTEETGGGFNTTPLGDVQFRQSGAARDSTVHEKYAKSPILTKQFPKAKTDKAEIAPGTELQNYAAEEKASDNKPEAFPPITPAKPQAQFDDTPTKESAQLKSAETRQSLWALEGVRSLPIEFQPERIQTTFQSLGEEPRLSVTVVDRQRLDLLAWCVGLLIVLRGLSLTMQPRWRRFRFVATTLVVSFALPLILPWTGLISPVCNMAFYAACWLAVYYLAAGIVKRILRFGRGAMSQRRGAPAAVAILGMLSLLLARSASAEDPPAPIAVPPNAIIVPYDPDKPDFLEAIKALSGETKPGAAKHEAKIFGMEKSQKLLVPYKKYLDLQRAAHPDEVVKPTPPAEYAFAGGRFTTRLDDGESLLVEGNLDIDVLVDHAVSIPLSLGGGVLTKAEVDGKPGVAATLKNIEPPPQPNDGSKPAARPQAAESRMALIVTGAGRRHVVLSMRFPLQHRGGWQIAEGRLPTPPAAALTLQVAKAETEVVLSGGVDHGNFETHHDNESLETALASDGSLATNGAFRVQWRAKAGPAPMDQSLAARGTALLDVREDGLRLVWRFDLEFRGAQRDSFVVDILDGYLVEKVSGANVRGWILKEAGGLRKLEVTLLKAAQDAESFSVALARRGAVGSGELAQFAAPVLSVEGAAQQSGELSIRRSPLLELRVESASGASRADGEATPTNANADGNESPLGIVPFQVYRFATTPFSVKLSAQPVAPHVSAEFQTVLRISEQQRALESRIRMRVDKRPIYRLRIALPEDLRLDRVNAPEPFQWVVDQEGNRRLLNLYFSAGQRQSFDIVLAGSLGKYGKVESIDTPKVEIVDADEQKESIEQSGDIAIEVDPSLDVRAEKLVHCEPELLERVNTWLNPAQQSLARLALRFRTPDYAAQLQLSQRKPLVHCDTFTNIRVNERTVEETILLDFTIREAGIRSLSFLLPESLQTARISSPMLRQKTIEPVGKGAAAQVRVTIELQEEVMGTLRVLIEGDRLLTAEKYTVPATVVETGQTDHRYITLESSGRDEIVVDAHEGVDPISQEQTEWRMLTAMLGRGLTQAYLVRPSAAEPKLILHTQNRAAVETAGARIGLAKAMLVVDANGAYRGAQLYRVDNSLEQFLEIELPSGARLWTAHVAGEPVKPAAGKAAGTAGEVVRIPLIKTAHGDADYPVMLKYGGQLGPLSAIDRVRFPLIRTVNIHVELSQVELYVPEKFDWFNFGGTMRRVQNEGDLAAGWLAYNTRQIDLAIQAWQSGDAFSRARATNNLKSLQAESAALKQSAEGYQENADVAQQLQANSSIQKKLGEDVNRPVDSIKFANDGDNRDRFNSFYKSQLNKRANEVVNSAGENFAEPIAQTRPASKDSGKDFGREPGKEMEQGPRPSSGLGNVVADPFGRPASAQGGGGKGAGQLGTATTEGNLNSVSDAGSSQLFSNKLDGQPAAPSVTFNGETTISAGTLTVSGNGAVGNAGSTSTLTLTPSDASTPAMTGLTLNGGVVNQPEFEESGGGRAQSDLQRYADRLAQQQPHRGPESYSLNGGDARGDRAAANATTPTAGPMVTGSAGLPKAAGGSVLTAHGTGTLTLSGTNGYSGVVSDGAQPAGNPQANNQTQTGKLQIGNAQQGVSVAPAVLASLEVDLHPRGVKYLFTTPRGEAEITAQAVSSSLVGRVSRLMGLAVALLAVSLLVAAARRWRAARQLGRA